MNGCSTNSLSHGLVNTVVNQPDLVVSGGPIRTSQLQGIAVSMQFVLDNMPVSVYAGSWHSFTRCMQSHMQNVRLFSLCSGIHLMLGIPC